MAAVLLVTASCAGADSDRVRAEGTTTPWTAPASQQADDVDDAAWSSALATLDDRPARVVVVSDSIGELTSGFHAAWQGLLEGRSTGAVGTWLTPRRFGGDYTWPAQAGEPVPAGLDQYGQEVPSGAGAVGSPEVAMPIPTTLDVYFTALPDGSDLEVRIGGELVGTIDTSLDEFGTPVTDGARPAQRWRSPELGAYATWSLTPVGPGRVVLGAVAMPPAVGIEVHGTGLAGSSTADILAAGEAIAHLEAMTARGERPDLVVWAVDTADRPDLDAVAEAFAATRAAAPGATIAHYVPPAHGANAAMRDWWGDTSDRLAAQASAERVVVIDGRVLGDVSAVADPEGLSRDGVHFSVKGNKRLAQVWIEALRRTG